MPPWHTRPPMDTPPTESRLELTHDEEGLLLQVARAALETAVQTGFAEETWLPPMEIPQRLLEDGAAFVTLHVDGALRGCIGSAQAYRPVVLDVAQNTMRAALFDPRFESITPEELPRADIEISILTPPTRLVYQDDQALLAQIRLHIDGVMIVYGYQHALLLPQMWDVISDQREFLMVLCRKAGLPDDAYLGGKLQVYTFQCHVIREE